MLVLGSVNPLKQFAKVFPSKLHEVASSSRNPRTAGNTGNITALGSNLCAKVENPWTIGLLRVASRVQSLESSEIHPN